jgi:isopentenyl-diphosphate Delta-isomerase
MVSRARQALMSELDPEALVLVDESDRDIGFLSQRLCHEGRGVLHRAFSLLIFNDYGELLIQQRSASKRLWPMYWSNSCCSHPRAGESMDAATQRRMAEELGISCPLTYLYKFECQAQYDATGAEHELCSVYIGRWGGRIKVNSAEILDWRWVSPEALQREISTQGSSSFTPWFLEEWARIWRDHRPAVLSLVR